MFRAFCLGVAICAALASIGQAMAEDDDAGGFTLYPPMTPEAPGSDPEPLRVSIAPGDLPESETLLLDGSAVLRAAPPEGYCRVSVQAMLVDIFKLQYGLEQQSDGLSFGYAVDCAIFEDHAEADPYPISIMLQPIYANGIPMVHALQRAELLAGLWQQVDAIEHPEIAFDGEEEAAPVIAQWMRENAVDHGEETRHRIGGYLGRDTAAGYIAVLIAGGVREGKRVFRAAVVGCHDSQRLSGHDSSIRADRLARGPAATTRSRNALRTASGRGE